jgi:DNA-binding response OmpR family regulator
LERTVRVLVAEDNTALRSVLERGLRENGYVVDSVGDGSAALRHLRAYEYDVAVLDWRMPQQTGVEVIEELRRAGDRTPILMLTARDTASDRVTGLDSGADDYLVKPFEISELFARIRALQRRPPLTMQPVLECADLRFDPATRVVSVSERPIAATAIETALIELLLRRSPAIVTRRTIALQVWNDEADAVGSNTIDVHIGRVRAKLSDSHAQIETVRGLGYRMSKE